ncbi:MAG: 30S ribosomal protein S20 [Elusimicrobiota bacterium]|jgi:small subunit ribosomal protein S20|nr:30S ribosomal protein S20 [Elusimicrobiota bacterium]
MAKLKTGRHTSSLKELKKNKKRNKINTSKKSLLKTLSKKVLLAVKNKDIKNAKIFLDESFSAYDKASKTNTIHLNKSARKKSQLAKMVASIEV